MLPALGCPQLQRCWPLRPTIRVARFLLFSLSYQRSAFSARVSGEAVVPIVNDSSIYEAGPDSVRDADNRSILKVPSPCMTSQSTDVLSVAILSSRQAHAATIRCVQTTRRPTKRRSIDLRHHMFGSPRHFVRTMTEKCRRLFAGVVYP